MSLFIKSCIVSTCQPSDGVMDYVNRYNLQDNIPEPVFSGTNCLVSTCQPDDTIPEYLGGYNIQDTVPLGNSAILIPVGGGFYVSVPPNTYNVPYNPNGGTFSLFTGLVPCPSNTSTVQGCDRTYSYKFPAGSTPAQQQSILNQAAAEVATIKAQCCLGLPDTVTNPPPTPETFASSGQSVSCGGSYSGMQISGSLPGYLTSSGTTLSIVPGAFTSTVSQADADSQANLALNEFFDGGNVVCGWYNQDESVTCPDGKTSDVPAGTIFSAVSQADANAKAIALAQMLCAGLMLNGWTWTNTTQYANNGATITYGSGGNTGEISSQGPQVMFVLPQALGDSDGTWMNPCSIGTLAIQITVVMNYACTAAFPGGGGGTAKVTFGNSGGASKTYVFDHLSGSTTDNTISVSPGQSFFCNLEVGGTSNSNGSYNSMLSCTMYCRFVC